MTLVKYSDEVQRSLPDVDVWAFKITGAKTAVPITPNSVSMIAFDSLTQDEIDAFFGTSGEFAAAKFDSTAMGNDATAAFFKYDGQVRRLSHAVARCYSATQKMIAVAALGTGCTASTLETAAEVSAKGNVAVKMDWGNTPDMDALTAGIIEVELHFFPK